MGGCRARSGCSSCTYAAAYKAYTPDTICHCPCRYPDTQIPRYPRYPVRRMAKQSCQEVHPQEGRVPSNAFLRESSTSEENRICSNFVGKPGTHLDSNGPLASTFSDIVEAVLSAVDIALDATVGPFWESNEAIDWFEINQRR